MRKILLICLSTVTIILMLFPNGNYETVASINIGEGKDDFLIKHVPESGEYRINTYITSSNEFCMLFPNNKLIRKYTPDFASYKEIQISDSLIQRFTKRGDAEFIEGFMVEENDDLWLYFCSSEVKHGSVVAHQYSDISYDVFYISDAWLDVVSFIHNNEYNYLYGDWFYKDKYIYTSICLEDLNISDKLMDLVKIRPDSVYLGIDLNISKNNTKLKQINHKVYLSGDTNRTINLQFEGPNMVENPDYDIYHWPEVDREGSIITLLRNNNKIQIMRRKLM